VLENHERLWIERFRRHGSPFSRAAKAGVMAEARRADNRVAGPQREGSPAVGQPVGIISE